MVDTRTDIDLGEDLLDSSGSSQRSQNTGTQLVKGVSLEERLQNAQILMSEGLLSEAKHILFSIVMEDENHVPARKKLEEIHELELKQIFTEETVNKRILPTQSIQDSTLTVAPVLNRFVLENVIDDLEKDFDLNLNNQNILEDLFPTQAHRHRFIKKLEKDLETCSAQDRVDMGIAFLEMGLFDFAIQQFQVASKHEDFRVSASFLLAHTWILKRSAVEAIFILEPFIADTELSTDVKVHIYYLMARAHEQLKKSAEARLWFQKTLEINAAYRDAKERMVKLSSSSS